MRRLNNLVIVLEWMERLNQNLNSIPQHLDRLADTFNRRSENAIPRSFLEITERRLVKLNLALDSTIDPLVAIVDYIYSRQLDYRQIAGNYIKPKLKKSTLAIKNKYSLFFILAQKFYVQLSIFGNSLWTHFLNYSFRTGVRKKFFAVQAMFFLALIFTAIFATQRTSHISAVANSSVKVPQNKAPAPNSKFAFGVYITTPSSKAIEAKLGEKLDLLGWFVHWNDNIQSKKLNYACNNGYTPVITWESWKGGGSLDAIHSSDYSIGDIASGKFDQIIRSSLRRVHETCKDQTVIIRFDHEMNSNTGNQDWYPWQGNPEAYISAWRRIVDLSHKIDPNIKWLWSPNITDTSPDQYYPGARYVDYVGLTINRPVTNTQFSTFADNYSVSQGFVEKYNKPIMISETTSSEQIGDKPAWVSGMFDYVSKNPKIVGLVWFRTVPSYEYDSSPATLKAFQQGLISLNQIRK